MKLILPWFRHFGREIVVLAIAKPDPLFFYLQSLSFMPTSVMRKMQESRDRKMPGEEMLGGPLAPGEADGAFTFTSSDVRLQLFLSWKRQRLYPCFLISYIHISI